MFVVGVYACVDNRYGAIVLHGVEGLAVAKVALEGVVEACYLVPAPHVALNVEVAHGAAVDVIRLGTARECRE